MNIEQIREYCLVKPNTEECLPFDQDTLVYKVTLKNGKSKMFALISISKPDYLIVKCDPDLAVDLRDRYPCDIEGAYHCNKKYWNGIKTVGVLSSAQICEMIDHSYDLVCGFKITF